VAGIGEIEALVAQRKIRDAVFPYCNGQTLPVVKGYWGATGQKTGLRSPVVSLTVKFYNPKE
jgi:hypothetical protein